MKRGRGLIIWGSIVTILFATLLVNSLDIWFSLGQTIVLYPLFGLWPLLAGIGRERSYRRAKKGQLPPSPSSTSTSTPAPETEV